MDIRKQLLKEHTKNNTQKVANYIGGDKEKFKKLMIIFFDNENIVAQRASWVISHCADENPFIVYPFIEKMLKNLDGKNLHNAVIRNTIRVLQFVDIPEKLLGHAYNKCFSLLTSREQPVAIKVFSMTVLYNICIKEPELKNELISILKTELEHESAGYKSRAKKIITKLSKLS